MHRAKTTLLFLSPATGYYRYRRLISHDVWLKRYIYIILVAAPTLHYIIIMISLLMSPLLGHMPSLWITHKENGP
jgi:hypothetical protein